MVIDKGSAPHLNEGYIMFIWCVKLHQDITAFIAENKLGHTYIHDQTMYVVQGVCMDCADTDTPHQLIFLNKM